MVPRKTAVRSVLTVLASFLIVAFAGILYTNHVQREAKQDFRQALQASEQKWCAVLGIFESAYAANPPTTPQGRDVAAQMHTLYIDFRCPSG